MNGPHNLLLLDIVLSERDQRVEAVERIARQNREVGTPGARSVFSLVSWTRSLVHRLNWPRIEFGIEQEPKCCLQAA